MQDFISGESSLIETVFTFILNERIKIITPEKMAAEKGDLDKFAQRLSGQLKITDADIERSELCLNIQILWQDKSSLRRTVVNALALFCIKMEGRIEFDTDTQKLDQDIFFGWCKKMGLTSKTLDLIKGASAYFSDIHFIEDEVYLGNSNTKYSDGIKDLIPIKVAKKESEFV